MVTLHVVVYTSLPPSLPSLYLSFRLIISYFYMKSLIYSLGEQNIKRGTRRERCNGTKPESKEIVEAGTTVEAEGCAQGRVSRVGRAYIVR